MTPDLFRTMKRLWEKDPDNKGLLKRREDKAKFFANGL